MTNPVDIDQLARMMDALHAAHRLPEGVVVLPEHYKLESTEVFQATRNRLRGRFSTALVEDFANYFARNAKADKLAHAPIFIAPDALHAVAVLDWMTGDDQPGHMQHCAVCVPQALPEWASLQAIHNKPLSQDQMIDLVEDMAGLVSAFDDEGHGMPPSVLVGAFRNARITKQSEHVQALEDSSVKRSAMETIDANASRRVPPKMTFHVVPFAEFSARAVTARVIMRAHNNEPAFTLRIVNYEGLQRDIALEFVALIQRAITGFFDGEGNDAPVVYVGGLSFPTRNEV